MSEKNAALWPCNTIVLDKMMIVQLLNKFCLLEFQGLNKPAA
jgi:hypothetical protein